MIRTIRTISTLLLLAILATSVMQFSSIKTANAINASVIYAVPNNMMDTNEAQATTSGCAAIRYYFSLTGDYTYLENYCGSNTVNSVVYSVANYHNTYYNWAATFYKGHSIWAPPGTYPNVYPQQYNHNIYNLYPDNSNDTSARIWDETSTLLGTVLGATLLMACTTSRFSGLAAWQMN